LQNFAKFCSTTQENLLTEKQAQTRNINKFNRIDSIEWALALSRAGAYSYSLMEVIGLYSAIMVLLLTISVSDFQLDDFI